MRVHEWKVVRMVYNPCVRVCVFCDFTLMAGCSLVKKCKTQTFKVLVVLL